MRLAVLTASRSPLSQPARVVAVLLPHRWHTSAPRKCSKGMGSLRRMQFHACSRSQCSGSCLWVQALRSSIIWPGSWGRRSCCPQTYVCCRHILSAWHGKTLPKPPPPQEKRGVVRFVLADAFSTPAGPPFGSAPNTLWNCSSAQTIGSYSLLGNRLCNPCFSNPKCYCASQTANSESQGTFLGLF